MKNISLILLFVSFALGNTIQAAHVAAAKITHIQLDATTYLVSLAALRDCNGGSLGTTVSINMNGGACGSFSENLPLSYITEVSNSCDPVNFPTVCNGGTLPGFELVVYQDTLTLAANCGWTLSWSLCCRNNAILNLADPSSKSIYVEDIIDIGPFGINSSPEFLDATIPLVCLNTPVTRDPVIVDIEGDSLYFELVDALNVGAVPIPYVAGYTGAQPIPGITLDPFNGAVSFTPTMLGNFVVVTKVSEYRNGQFLGSVLFDRQFIVASCSNSNPAPTTNGMTNFSGNAVQTSPFTIAMCEGQNFCFDLSFSDPDVGQTLTAVADLGNVLPGATFTSTGSGPVTGTVCWTAPAGSAGIYPVVVNAVDSVCPLQGSATMAVLVIVTPGTYAGPDQTICNSVGANIGVFGFAPYQWTVLSGDPIVVGTNFSCDTCVSALAAPNQTTTYLLTSNAPTGCTLTDTVTVNVVANLTVTASPSDTLVCINQPVPLNALASPFDPTFTYSWSPTTSLSNPNIANPVYTSNSQGINPLIVTVGNGSGCNQTDTIYIEIISSPLNLDLGFDSIGISAPPVTMMGNPPGGTFLGAGVSGSIFNPAAAGLGTWIITYQAAGGCVGSSFDTVTVYQDVGISELLGNEDLLIIPNPAQDFFSLGADVKHFELLEIIDMQGKTIRTWNVFEPQFSLAGISKGNYLLKLSTEHAIRSGYIQKR